MRDFFFFEKPRDCEATAPQYFISSTQSLHNYKKGERGGREKAIYKTYLFTGNAQN
jgi:hypothetical protein